MAETLAAPRAPLTGGKVLAILLGFFVVVFAANGVMIFDAISTFRGQTADHPYEVGLKFNLELAAVAAQEIFEPQDIAIFGAANDDRSADISLENPHAAQDERAHNAFAEFGLLDHEK